MKVSQLCEEKEGIQAEMEAMRRLMQSFKGAAENAERKIQEYSLRESIAVRERDELKILMEKRIARISKQYVEFIARQDKQQKVYREFVIYEIENNDQIVEGLQSIIKKKAKEIEQL